MLTHIKLIAAAPTKELLLKIIGAFWCSPSNSYTIKGDKIIRVSDNSIVENYRIVAWRSKYLFQRVDSHKKSTDPKPETFETNEPIPY